MKNTGSTSKRIPLMVLEIELSHREHNRVWLCKETSQMWSRQPDYRQILSCFCSIVVLEVELRDAKSSLCVSRLTFLLFCFLFTKRARRTKRFLKTVSVFIPWKVFLDLLQGFVSGSCSSFRQETEKETVNSSSESFLEKFLM